MIFVVIAIWAFCIGLLVGGIVMWALGVRSVAQTREKYLNEILRIVCDREGTKLPFI